MVSEHALLRGQEGVLFPAGVRSRVRKFGLKYLRMLHKLGMWESGF